MLFHNLDTEFSKLYLQGRWSRTIYHVLSILRLVVNPLRFLSSAVVIKHTVRKLSQLLKLEDRASPAQPWRDDRSLSLHWICN